MANKRELSSLLDRLHTMRTITQTYQQIAGNHVRKARTSVVNNRDFVGELLTVFQAVKNAYREELLLLMKQKRIKDMNKVSLIKRNGKTTAVFLSANTGLYGTIVHKTATMLGEYLKRNKADVTIVGKLGEGMFQQQFPNRPYTFFEFPDGKIDYDTLKKVTEHLLQYERIYVFYGQFQSIVSQNPIIASIDGGSMEATNQNEQPVHYLFEPSLEKIMVFFETEIFGLVFEQTIRESQLAKHASRMYALDNAIQNINANLSKVNMQKHLVHHRTINSKQLNSLTGMSLWSGRK